jgi:EmrB/QacA subfamily drug resistance transporter
VMYVSGFAVFVGSSALCGLAPSVGSLVAFRAAQALGAAMLFANGPAILTGNFPAAQRGQALGLQATMTYLGLTAGPALGGFLAGRFGWRSVFYINVPVGALALALSARFIPRDRPGERSGRFDVAGAGAFLLSLMALLLALNQGHDWGWTSAPVLGLLAAAVAFGAVFVAIESRVASPMWDLRLFSSRIFSTSTASAVLNYICLYSIAFLMPFYLIQGRGLGPAQAGLILTAQPLVMAVAAPLSGTLSDRIGSQLLSTAGMAILGIGLLLLARLGSESSFGQVAGALVVVGIGIGIFISPNTSALMGAAPRNRQGIAAGVLATARNVGMVLGVGLAGAIFTTVVARGLAGDPASLFTAVRLSFVVAAGVGFLGAVVSAARGI